jgi:hypothetical protein
MRLALRQLGILVGIGVVLAAVVALFLPRHGYVHDFRTAGIVIGIVFAVFGAAAAGGTPMSYRVLENTRLPGLRTTTISDDDTMRVSATALLLVAGVLVIALAIVA